MVGRAGAEGLGSGSWPAELPAPPQQPIYHVLHQQACRDGLGYADPLPGSHCKHVSLTGMRSAVRVSKVTPPLPKSPRGFVPAA